MPAFIPHAGGLELRTLHEVVRIEPRGSRSVEVRAAFDLADAVLS